MRNGAVRAPVSVLRLTMNRSALAVVVALAAVICGALVALPARAAVIPGAITSISTSASTVGQWDTVSLSCEWEVPNGSQPGDTFTMQLPAQLKWFGSTSFDLLDDDGSVVATAVADDSGKVVFTLTDYVRTHPNDVHGDCSFTTQYAAPTQTETVELAFVVDGETIRVPLTTEGGCTGDCGPDRTKAAKAMWWVDGGQARTQSQILAPRTTAESSTVIITDTPGEGLALDCATVETAVGKVLKDGFITDPRDDAAHPAQVQCSANALTVTWTGLPTGEYTEIRVKADVTDDSRQAYTNDGTIDINGVSTRVSDPVKRTNASGTGTGGTPSPSTTQSPSTTPSPSTTQSPSASATPSAPSTPPTPSTSGTTVSATTTSSVAVPVGSGATPSSVEGGLAYTGSQTWQLLALALGLLVAGALALATRFTLQRSH